jgi:uncharacterized protein YggU (UPF0235/DUF167 family)
MQAHPEHTQTYIRVRAKAGARKERVTMQKEVYTIEVREKAEHGLANARIKEVLAQVLHVEVTQLVLIKGVTSPSKVFLLTNYTEYENKR